MTDDMVHAQTDETEETVEEATVEEATVEEAKEQVDNVKEAETKAEIQIVYVQSPSYIRDIDEIEAENSWKNRLRVKSKNKK